MGVLYSILSVCGSASDGRVCKFCYGEDGEELSWLHPCKCIGTLYWVHQECFALWMSRASAQQQLQCQTCRHAYSKSWELKPLKEWCIPELDLNGWQCLEVFLDFYSTYKFVRGLVMTIEGKRTFLMQLLHFCFWRTFIMSDRRIAWYTSLGRKALSGMFHVTVQQYDPNSSPTDDIGADEVWQVEFDHLAENQIR